ncbi:MAG: helix-turn-helix domain-containing protein [bacterium]
MKSGPSNGTKTRSKDVEIHRSSGNVFEDLGIPESAEALAKADIAVLIVGIIDRRGLTQSEAAKILGIDQPSISDLVRGKLRGFSSDRLFRFLNALGQDVEITIRRRPQNRRGRILVLGKERPAISAASRGRK